MVDAWPVPKDYWEQWTNISLAPDVNVLPEVVWAIGRSLCGRLFGLGGGISGWRHSSSGGGPWMMVVSDSLVAGITDICQVRVGSSLCLLGGWWRRRRWWRWWWTSCTSRTVAHCCLPQGLPAQLGEHTVSPMAGAHRTGPFLLSFGCSSWFSS